MKKDKLDIIYEDKDIIVINKPTHLLTISTDNEKERTLFHKVYFNCIQRYNTEDAYLRPTGKYCYKTGIILYIKRTR